LEKKGVKQIHFTISRTDKDKKRTSFSGYLKKRQGRAPRTKGVLLLQTKLTPPPECRIPGYGLGNEFVKGLGKNEKKKGRFRVLDKDRSKAEKGGREETIKCERVLVKKAQVKEQQWENPEISKEAV